MLVESKGEHNIVHSQWALFLYAPNPHSLGLDNLHQSQEDPRSTYKSTCNLIRRLHLFALGIYNIVNAIVISSHFDTLMKEFSVLSSSFNQWSLLFRRRKPSFAFWANLSSWEIVHSSFNKRAFWGLLWMLICTATSFLLTSSYFTSISLKLFFIISCSTVFKRFSFDMRQNMAVPLIGLVQLCFTHTKNSGWLIHIWK